MNARTANGVLAAIVEALAGRIRVLIDGGIRRATDVVKAVALGAEVAYVLELYRREIDRVRMLGRWDSLAAIEREVVRVRGAAR